MVGATATLGALRGSWLGRGAGGVGMRALLGLCALAASLSPGRAHAEEEGQALRTWQPSFALSIKAQQQRAEAQIVGSLNIDTEGRAATPVALDADNHDDFFTAIVPLELQLESPAISLPTVDVPVRGFVRAGYQWIPITDRDFITVGSAGTVPPNPSPASDGLGGQLRIDLQHQWSASVGLSFHFELAEIPFQVRPSLDYVGQWIRADARTVGVQDVTNRLFILDSDDTGAVHFLGPGLGIETDAGRIGAFRATVFAEGSLLASDVFGSQSLSGRRGQEGETLSFEYDPDNLLFQIGVGTRIYWDPR